MNPRLFFRHYTLTVVAVTVVLLLVAESLFLKLDLYRTLLAFLYQPNNLRTEETFFAVFVIGLSFAIDYARMARKRARKATLQQERLIAARSALASVHDLVNNALNNFLLIKMEAEKGEPLKPETIALFTTLIEDLARELRTLDETDIVSVRSLSNTISVIDRTGD